jgi:hypothetical protein
VLAEAVSLVEEADDASSVASIGSVRSHIGGQDIGATAPHGHPHREVREHAGFPFP